MKEEKSDTGLPDYLRSRAEDLLRKKKFKADIQGMTNEEVRALVYELQVYRIEMEMQNEELKRAHTEAEEALEKYVDLYDFAPIGYCTFDNQGMILEVNLTGAAFLGVERRNLINRHFQLFIKPDCIPVFNTFCNKVFETGTRQVCEIELLKTDTSSVPVRLEGTTIKNRQGKGSQCRTAITDITEQKLEGERVRLLQAMSMEIFAADSLQSVLDIILRRVCEATGWVYGEIWLLSPNGKHLEYGRAWHGNIEMLEEFMIRSKEYSFQPGVGLPGQAWAERRPVWIKDVALDQNYLRAEIAESLCLKAAVAFPLFDGEEIVAVFVSYMFKPFEKNEYLVSLVSLLSDYLGFIVKRKQLEDTIRQMAYRAIPLPCYRTACSSMTVSVWRWLVRGAIMKNWP